MSWIDDMNEYGEANLMALCLEIKDMAQSHHPKAHPRFDRMVEMAKPFASTNTENLVRDWVKWLALERVAGGA